MRSLLLKSFVALSFSGFVIGTNSLIFASPASAAVVVGSKKFTESVTLGEVLRLKLTNDGIQATHKAELGGTTILWNALVAGNIDAYVEYSGTLNEEILKAKETSFEDLNARLAAFGVQALPSLGFNNTYAIGLLETKASALNLKTISQLKAHPELKLGFANEFRLRADGWPGLQKRYSLPQGNLRGLDHDIAYRALQTGDVDVTDLYTTDAEISYYKLRTLDDDLHFFPKYEALILYRLKSAEQNKGFVKSLEQLTGTISDDDMMSMNHAVKIERRSSVEVAAQFLKEHLSVEVQDRAPSRLDRVWVRTQEHLFLVLISLAVAIVLGIPLGVLAAKFTSVGRVILGAVGTIQTIPALALLVVLIRPLNSIGLPGIGDTPALIALILYSLLPIVRSTHTGLEQIPAHLRETANVLNLSKRTKLFKIELPLALPSILSGIKTSAVLNVGFATLGALVGAGGYGQPILTGIRLDDYGLILEGALPAALMAVVAQLLFDLLEDRIVSPGLRSRG